jgi:DNA-binding response OmpR family regulator
VRPRIPSFDARRIVVADEDRQAVAFIIDILRDEGHIVFHAYDVLSATQLAYALDRIDLLISNTKVAGADGVDLILRLREDRPKLPIVYLANSGRSSPEIERRLPPDVPIVREPFTAEELRGVVRAMLDGARPSGADVAL